MSPAVKHAVHGFVNSEWTLLLSRASMIMCGAVMTLFIAPAVVWNFWTVYSTETRVTVIETTANALDDRVDGLETTSASLGATVISNGTRLSVLENQQTTLVQNTNQILQILSKQRDGLLNPPDAPHP